MAAHMSTATTKGQLNEALTQASRIVIKIGSALLVDATGELRTDWLGKLARDIMQLRAEGKEIVTVSSGAVALGAPLLPEGTSKRRLQESQAAAAVGQVRLAHAWQELFAAHDTVVAQILLTLEDTETRRRYLNARDTIDTLLTMGAVPVINENDTVATQEIRYGDNDRLAARVAQMISADGLVILSDVDGLYTDNPELNADAQFIDLVEDITPEIEAMAGEPLRMGVGSGGMITKVTAAQIAVASGCHVLLINGTHDSPITRFRETGRGTLFAAQETDTSQHKQWLAGTLMPAGTLVVDEGAEQALSEGKSLLAAGVTAVEGDFQRGDTVAITNQQNKELALGLAAYPSQEARLIMGHNSRELEAILGYRGRGELVHRDNMVLR
jgi:glutamate 5-kinase